jgi:hypothetical protein
MKPPKSKNTNRINEKAKELGLTLIRGKGSKTRAKSIFKRTGGYNNLLNLGLEEWPQE